MNFIFWSSVGLSLFGASIWGVVKAVGFNDRDRVIDRIVIPFIALVLAVVGTLFVILWYEPHPIASFRRDVEPTVVRPGSEVFIRSSVTRLKDGCPSHIKRWFNDASGNRIGSHERFNEAMPKGHEEFRSSVFIPPNAAPGILVLHVEVEFFCNFVQRSLGGSHLLLPDVFLKVEGL